MAGFRGASWPAHPSRGAPAVRTKAGGCLTCDPFFCGQFKLRSLALSLSLSLPSSPRLPAKLTPVDPSCRS